MHGCGSAHLDTALCCMGRVGRTCKHSPLKSRVRLRLSRHVYAWLIWGGSVLVQVVEVSLAAPAAAVAAMAVWAKAVEPGHQLVHRLVALSPSGECEVQG